MTASSMLINIFLLIAIHQWCTLVQSDNPPLRKTSSGEIRGLKRNVLNREVNVFLGIPYAEPPLGERRFQRPEKIKAWSGTRDATKLPNACYQMKDTSFEEFEGVSMWNANTEISEDCLYLNVWQPMGGTSNKAILIWVFGGGFYSGSSALSLYDGSILAAEGDVVVMSMQYRLGPLGFLYLKGGVGDKATALGNMGLIDQNLAIQWMKENAEIFGGNPNQMTLFGESAGAGSVSLHLLSPLTQNLIKSSIMQSGSALAPWAMDLPDRAHTGGLELAALLGCTSGNFSRTLSAQERSSIMECLKKANAQEIVEMQWNLNVEKNVIYVAFSPTIDGYFLTETPSAAAVQDAMKRSSILIGVNHDEGMAFLFYLLMDLYPRSPKAPDVTKVEFENSIRTLFHFARDVVTDVISFEYGEPCDCKKEEMVYRNILDDVVGDLSFKCPVMEFAKIYAGAKKNVYMYQLNHRTSANPWPEWAGVMHGFEIDHVFGLPLNTSLRYRPEEVQLSKKIMKYWTNFAKTGDPNRETLNGLPNVEVVWPVYDSSTRKVIMFNSSSIYIEPAILHRKCEFWKRIYPRIREEESSHGNSISRLAVFNEVQLTAILCLAIALLCRYDLPGM